MIRFGELMMWETFYYNGVRFMKNSTSTAVNMETNRSERFDVTTVVSKSPIL